MTTTSPTERPTAERILDIAQRLVQTRGFTNFSYADIAAELGITKASLHYHFPGKAELGTALVQRHSADFTLALAEIDESAPNARAALEAYVGLYGAVAAGERMCLCGVLAGEFETLPVSMRVPVRAFFDDNVAWLGRVLAAGEDDGSLTISGRRDDVARAILSALEGAMLVARPYGDPAMFDATARRLLHALTG